jgi:5'-3' exonuclease
MILLVDADSLIFASCYSNDKQGQFYEDIEDAINKFDQQFMKIVNDLEERFEIEKVITFNGSKGNFRKKITPVYKANRKKQDLPPLLHDMHDYVKKQYNSVYGYGIETDDLVSAYWFTLSKDLGRENVMIVSIDKDYRQFPALIYNYHYNHREIIDITPEEAMFNFYSQMIEGDTADNVNYFKGKGKKFAENYLKNCKTKYQYTKKMYELFKDKYKGKARQKYVECYNLLKLREQ